jgi:hypothetical protein
VKLGEGGMRLVIQQKWFGVAQYPFSILQGYFGPLSYNALLANNTIKIIAIIGKSLKKL